jgi:hypothetical protein
MSDPAAEGVKEIGTLVNDQYRIAKRLGGGSFGDIYLGQGPNGGWWLTDDPAAERLAVF